MLPHSGANLRVHNITFVRDFGTCIVGVQLDQLTFSFTDSIVVLSASYRRKRWRRSLNLALSFPMSYIVEYLCFCVTVPVRNTNTHDGPSLPQSPSPITVNSHNCPFERTATFALLELHHSACRTFGISGFTVAAETASAASFSSSVGYSPET
jgi:hypothetical protein